VTPRQGEVWLVALDPVRGREQGGRRPCVVVSADAYNRLPIEMVVVVPITTRDRGLRAQPPIQSARSGLSGPSFARPEDVRAISAGRLVRALGRVDDDELRAIQAVLRRFFGL
jgi:mRNA interferase MazF